MDWQRSTRPGTLVHRDPNLTQVVTAQPDKRRMGR